jgi:hypothetical protein
MGVLSGPLACATRRGGTRERRKATSWTSDSAGRSSLGACRTRACALRSRRTGATCRSCSSSAPAGWRGCSGCRAPSLLVLKNPPACDASRLWRLESSHIALLFWGAWPAFSSAGARPVECSTLLNKRCSLVFRIGAVS